MIDPFVIVCFGFIPTAICLWMGNLEVTFDAVFNFMTTLLMLVIDSSAWALSAAVSEAAPVVPALP